MNSIKNPRYTVIFVIQGKEFPVDVNPNRTIKGAVEHTLAEAGNPGSIEGWQLRTDDGRQLDLMKSFEDEGIIEPTKLFLSKGPGRGG